MELGEYDVVYRPATAIKSQVLADFVVEFSPTMLPALEQEINLRNEGGETGEWTLHVDGSSNIRGAGVRIILTSTAGNTTLRAVRCNFKATNNISKYEALSNARQTNGGREHPGLQRLTANNQLGAGRISGQG